MSLVAAKTFLLIVKAAKLAYDVYNQGIPTGGQLLDIGERFGNLGVQAAELSRSNPGGGYISGVSFGAAAERKLQIGKANGHSISELTNRLYVDNDLVEAVNVRGQQSVRDVALLRAALKPLGGVDPSLAYSSQVSPAAPGVLEHLEVNPKRVLMNLAPLGQQPARPEPNHVPILFLRNGAPFVGWQLRGVLPQMFGCDFNPQPGVSIQYDTEDFASDLDEMIARPGLKKKDQVVRIDRVTPDGLRAATHRNIEAQNIWSGVSLPGSKQYERHIILFDVNQVIFISTLIQHYSTFRPPVSTMSLGGFIRARMINRGLLNQHIELSCPETHEAVRIEYLRSRDKFVEVISFLQGNLRKLVT